MDDEPSLPPEPAVMTPLVAVVWVIGTFFLFLFSIALLASLRPGLESDGVSGAAVNSAVFLFVSALMLGRYPGGERLSDALGARATNPILPLLGVLIGASAQVPAEALYRLVQRFSPLAAGEEERVAEMLKGTSLTHSALLFVFLAIVVPVAEEVFFRGALFGALRRSGFPLVRTTIFTSVCFTIFHPDLRLWLPIGFLALVLGGLRALSGSLWSTLGLHIGFNAVTMVSSMTSMGPRLEQFLEPVPRQIGATIGFLILLLLFVLVASLDGRTAANREEECRAV